MTLVDSNVLIDVLDGGGRWVGWSLTQLDTARRGGLCINAIVYAEIAPTFTSAIALDAFLDQASITLAEMPRIALWAAGGAQARYRAAGGARMRVLADFIIGAHAQALACPLLTRDPRRYRSYFPDLRLITP